MLLVKGNSYYIEPAGEGRTVVERQAQRICEEGAMKYARRKEYCDSSDFENSLTCGIKK